MNPFFLRFSGNWPIPGIRWYGLAYVLAFLCVALLLHVCAKKNRLPFPEDQCSNWLFLSMLGVVIGGRVGYVLLYDFTQFLRDPLEIFRIWHGGMSSHGGFLGVFLAFLYFSKKQNVSLLRQTDLLVSMAPLGIFFGRIANFINGELYGRISNAPWAMVFPQSAPVNFPLEWIAPRHPSQIYEAFLEGLFLFFYCQYRFWKTDAQKKSGHLSGEFLILYGAVRIIGECFREPDAPRIFAMTAGQFYSVILIFVGIFVRLCLKKSAQITP